MQIMQESGADEFLIESIRAGDQQAWRQLIDRFEGRLRAFARARIASRTDADDLVQETFVGFIQSLRAFDATQSLETYLFSILRHKLYDQLRRRKPAVLAPATEPDDWWERIDPGTQETPSMILAQAEAQRGREHVLADVLRRLIHEYRDRSAFDDLQVIELIFFAGRRNLEVAELLDLDQKAVAGVKFRAIGRLRQFLDELNAPLPDDEGAEVTVARVWRDRRLTCLKRGTLGSYALGVLEEPWLGYTQFHLDVVGCPLCLANLQDLENDDSAQVSPVRESIFASSVGFLSRTTPSS